MDKVKKEGFTDFNYSIIKSIDNRCVDVKCTYKYGTKNLTHYFSYAKSGNKPSSYYLDRAKVEMDKLMKSSKAKSTAKKDLTGKKATFFRRHKKPILVATTVALIAGVAAAGTLVALKFLNQPDPTAVTEEEIDKYLEGPTGNTSLLSSLFVDKILDEAFTNFYDDNLKNFEMKTMSSMPVMNLIDEFLIKSDSNMVMEQGSDVVSLLNDTSKFYSNNQFKSKNYYGSYLNVSLLEDKKQSYAAKIHSFDTYNGLTNGSSISSKGEAATVIKHAANPDIETKVDYPYINFMNRKYIYDGYSGANLEGSKKIYQSDDESESKKRIKNYYFMQAAEFLSGIHANELYMYRDRYRVTEDGSTVFLKIENDITDRFNPVSLMGIPVKFHYEAIWCFKNIDKLGWVLDSFASDGFLMDIFPSFEGEYPIIEDKGISYLLAPTYVDYSENGEKLSNPICVNKDKGFTKLTYGELDKDESLDDITYTHDTTLEAPLSVSGLYAHDQTTDEYVAKDITLYRRVDDHNFNGYSFLGTIAPDPQCSIGSGIIFQYSPVSPDNKAGATYLDYTKLEKYLNKEFFEKGEKFPGEDLYLIKLKKAGWLTFEIVFDDKLQLSNVIIHFNEGPSPIIK